MWGCGSLNSHPHNSSREENMPSNTMDRFHSKKMRGGRGKEDHTARQMYHVEHQVSYTHVQSKKVTDWEGGCPVYMLL